MNKTTSTALGVATAILIVMSSYISYALYDLNTKIASMDIGFGQAKASTYSFNSTENNIEDLPDMAGGC